MLSESLVQIPVMAGHHKRSLACLLSCAVNGHGYRPVYVRRFFIILSNRFKRIEELKFLVGVISLGLVPL